MLPNDFVVRMKELLDDEYEAFIDSYEKDEYKALRVNPLKVKHAESISEEGWSGSFPHLELQVSKVAWEPMGYYYEDARPGKHPYHEAGTYYIQEPSAMKPVTLLEPMPGENVLDMCAAPGGKTTQIAGRMKGEGLLICNEYVPSRAKILSENIERMGVRNAIVLNETPAHLAETFVDYFDKILVDAPCSGEGMFRKNEDARQEWSLDNVKMCAERQDEILDAAATMLKPGGVLVYSTCTFAKEEDEECMERFIKRHPDYQLEISERLFPHKVKGEGHYIAKLSRQGDISQAKGYTTNGAVEGKAIGAILKKPPKSMETFVEFYKDTIKTDTLNLKGNLINFGDNLYLLPEDSPGIKGLKVLRPGLWLGTFMKNRFEPSHALALALSADQVNNHVDIGSDFAMAYDYINGMTFNHTGTKGWYLICIDGYSLGWGKLAGNIMKNHYPKGLRKNLK